MSDQLPIPDYDHLPLGSLTHRIRTLDVGQIVALLDHERAHADRLPVVQVLEQRLAALRSGDAEPSGGDPAAAQPEHAPPPSGGSPTAMTNETDNNQPYGTASPGRHRTGRCVRADEPGLHPGPRRDRADPPG
jgi:hypothetical protein